VAFGISRLSFAATTTSSFHRRSFHHPWFILQNVPRSAALPWFYSITRSCYRFWLPRFSAGSPYAATTFVPSQDTLRSAANTLISRGCKCAPFRMRFLGLLRRFQDGFSAIYRLFLYHAHAGPRSARLDHMPFGLSFACQTCRIPQLRTGYLRFELSPTTVHFNNAHLVAAGTRHALSTWLRSFFLHACGLCYLPFAFAHIF